MTVIPYGVCAEECSVRNAGSRAGPDVVLTSSRCSGMYPRTSGASASRATARPLVRSPADSSPASSRSNPAPLPGHRYGPRASRFPSSLSQLLSVTRSDLPGGQYGLALSAACAPPARTSRSLRASPSQEPTCLTLDPSCWRRPVPSLPSRCSPQPLHPLRFRPPPESWYRQRRYAGRPHMCSPHANGFDGPPRAAKPLVHP